MARGMQMPIIGDDTELDGVLGQLSRLRASARKRKSTDSVRAAELEAEVIAKTVQLSELKAATAAALAQMDKRSRVLLAAIVRYVSAHWDRLKTSTTRMVRASGIKLTRREGQLSVEAADEEAAVAELISAGLGHLVRYRPVLNRQALHDCARATEDGTGVIVTIGEGANAREVTITTVHMVRGPGVWQVEIPALELKFDATDEDLADLLRSP